MHQKRELMRKKKKPIPAQPWDFIILNLKSNHYARCSSNQIINYKGEHAAIIHISLHGVQYTVNKLFSCPPPLPPRVRPHILHQWPTPADCCALEPDHRGFRHGGGAPEASEPRFWQAIWTACTRRLDTTGPEPSTMTASTRVSSAFKEIVLWCSYLGILFC